MSIVAHLLLTMRPRCVNGQRSTKLIRLYVFFVVAVASSVTAECDITVRKLISL